MTADMSCLQENSLPAPCTMACTPNLYFGQSFITLVTSPGDYSLGMLYGLQHHSSEEKHSLTACTWWIHNILPFLILGRIFF